MNGDALVRRALDQLSCGKYPNSCDCDGCKARRALDFALYDGESLRAFWYKLCAQLDAGNGSWISQVGKSAVECCLDEISRLQSADRYVKDSIATRSPPTPPDKP